MNPKLTKPVLVTGASGALGRSVVRDLAAQGWTLRLTDIVPFPDALPANASFRRVDLGDALETVRLVEGCGVVVHLGGASTDEFPFEAVSDANLRGMYHLYEGARLAGARVIFASSNHAIGFHPRSEKLDSDCALKPDSLYGLSKAFGELLAGLYWTKHRVESVLVRIGSCFPEPVDNRMLSLWLSYADFGRLVVAAAQADTVECFTIWGASNNARAFWGRDDRERIGWQPQDSADGFADALSGKRTDNPVVERYQGGVYCARG